VSSPPLPDLLAKPRKGKGVGCTLFKKGNERETHAPGVGVALFLDFN